MRDESRKVQEGDLRAAGYYKIFREQVSSVAERQQLEAALDYVREGHVRLHKVGQNFEGSG